MEKLLFMEISITSIVAVGILTIIVIGLLFYKNYRDKQELENKLNRDYRKPKTPHSLHNEIDQHT